MVGSEQSPRPGGGGHGGPLARAARAPRWGAQRAVAWSEAARPAGAARPQRAARRLGRADRGRAVGGGSAATADERAAATGLRAAPRGRRGIRRASRLRV